MRSDRQVIEIFHLIFVAHLGRRVAKDLFALKGGCNLRFFFKSIRYSEDIDLDVHTIARETLRRNVDTILQSSALALELRSKRIQITHVSAAKQTDTTQRWKLGINVERGPTLPTKIEFSRRGLEDEHLLEAVDAELVHEYALRPVLTTHYSAEAALRQKIVALSRRNETQARDIFDLKHLLDRGAGRHELPPGLQADLAAAVDKAMTIGFDEFSGQVRAYLLPEYFDHYDRKTWEALQAEVIAALEGMA